MHQKPLGGRAIPGPAEELKRPDPLAAVKGLGPREGRVKGEGKRRRGWEKGGKGKRREGGEGRGYEKRPLVIRWLVTGLHKLRCCRDTSFSRKLASYGLFAFLAGCS